MASGNFKWSSEIDGDIYKSLSGIIKNQGYFKSDRQSNLFKPKKLNSRDKDFYSHYYLDHHEVKDIIGTIHIKGCSPLIYSKFKVSELNQKKKRVLVKTERKDQYLITVGGLSTFVMTGRGMIPSKWVFIIDSQGVVKKYKMRYEFLPRGPREAASGRFVEAILEFERKVNKKLELDIDPYDLTFREEKEKEKIKEKQKGSLVYLGTIGEKVTLSLTLKNQKTTYGRFGDSQAYFFEDDNKNKVIWFSSKDKDLKNGVTYKVEGKVKKHDEYNGYKQTYLTRCKILK